MLQSTGEGTIQVAQFLLLLHQLPVRPSAARVTTWRRLQRLGALPVGSAAYVLPDSAQAREDFAWLKREIQGAGGRATVFAADAIDDATAREIVGAFQAAR